MFNFPAGDSPMGQIWRQKCNIDSVIAQKKIKICDIHFEPSDIGKKFLKRHAEPMHFLDSDNENNENIFVEPVVAAKNTSRQSCKYCVQQAKNAKFYLRRIAQVNKINKKLKMKVSLLEKRLAKQLINQIEEVDNISEESKTFSKMLVRSRQKTYNDESRTIAQNIYYVSRNAYLFLRNKLHLNLPHKDSICNWTPIKNLKPGFKNSGFVVFLKNINTLCPVEKSNVVMIFDEMAIRAELKYNQKLDIIDGFHDDGFQRTSAQGKQVSVFMVKGLFSNWAFILNYFISEKGLSGDIVSKIVYENLTTLKDNGVAVKAIVCDQASANRKAFKTFGVTPENPFFVYNNQKVFCIYDFPHLIKSLRNTLLTGNLVTPDGIVSFNAVKELWEREQSAPTKLCPKLSRQHIEPKNFEKMKVKFATQLFSRTVSAAIKTQAEVGGFKTCTLEVALSTAQFFERVDKIFYAMNSCTLRADNKYRSALQKNNDPYLQLKSFSTYLEEVRCENIKSYVHFLKGMKISINAVAQLADEIFNDASNEKFFICTKALNQDKLENTFSLFRQRGGNNRFPSAAEINGIIAKIMCCKLIQLTSSGNCESTETSSPQLQIGDSSIAETSLNINMAENDEHNQSASIRVPYPGLAAETLLVGRTESQMDEIRLAPKTNDVVSCESREAMCSNFE